jgi:hypothetical protein
MITEHEYVGMKHFDNCQYLIVEPEIQPHICGQPKDEHSVASECNSFITIENTGYQCEETGRHEWHRNSSVQLSWR